MDQAQFSSTIVSLVENYRPPNLDGIMYSKDKLTCLTVWTREIHKFIEWSDTCSPQLRSKIKWIIIFESL